MPLERLEEELESIADARDVESLKALLNTQSDDTGTKSPSRIDDLQTFKEAMMEVLTEIDATTWTLICLLAASTCLFLWFYILTLVRWFMLVYALWKVIPPQRARTSPGMAVGLLFVPLFNLYWMFIVYYGLSNQMNQEAHINGIRNQVNSGAVLCMCSFMILGTFGSGFFALIALVLQYVMFRKLTNLAKEIAGKMQ